MTKTGKYYRFDVRARNGKRGCYEVYDEHELFAEDRMPHEILDNICLAKNVGILNGKHIIFALWQSFIQSDNCPTWVHEAEPKNIILIWNELKVQNGNTYHETGTLPADCLDSGGV